MSIVDISNFILLEIIFSSSIFIVILYIVLNIQYYLGKKRDKNKYKKNRKEVNT